MSVPLSGLARHELRGRAEVVWTAASLKFCERLELLCAMAGAKSLVRLVAEDETVGTYLALAEQLGLKARPSAVRQAPVRLVAGDSYTRSVPWNDPQGRWFSVFLSTEDSVVEEAVRVESGGGDSATIGTLLGYPKCCIERYRTLSGPEWLGAVLDEFVVSSPAPCVSNPLARLFSGDTFLPDFFPCSLYCPNAKQLGDRCRAVLQGLGYDAVADRVSQELRKRVLRIGRTVLVQFGSSWHAPDCLEFDPALIRSYGIPVDEARSQLRQGRLLTNSGKIDVPSDCEPSCWKLIEFCEA